MRLLSFTVEPQNIVEFKEGVFQTLKAFNIQCNRTQQAYDAVKDKIVVNFYLQETHMNFILVRGRIEKATLHSAAFDLFATESMLIGDKPVAVPTGVYTQFSPRLVAIIKEKSGLAVKGIEVKAGVIDADYRKEWKVVLRNPIQCVHVPERNVDGNPTGRYVNTFDPYWKPYQITAGDKIAQVLLVELPYLTQDVNQIGPSGVWLQAGREAEVSIIEQERTGGFGSTGK